MPHFINKGFLAKISMVVALLLAASAPPPGNAAEPVRVNGSGSGLHMMTPLVEAYAKSHPEVTFEMDKPLGSSGSIKAVIAGAMDIAVSTRKLKPEEIQAGAILEPYGQTPLTLATHASVTKKDITTQELVDIFSGKTLNWPDGQLIRLILRPVEDTDTTILRQISPEMDAAMASAHKRPGMTIAITDPEAAEAIAQTPGAMGACGLTGVIVEQPPLNVMTLNGSAPTTESLAKGSFPLAKPINIITVTASLPEPAKQFLAFVYSPEGKKIAEAAGVLISTGEAMR